MLRSHPGWWRRLKESTAGWVRPPLQKDFVAAYGRVSYLPDQRLDGLNGMLAYDLTLGMLPDLLRYADRNAMAHGREVRLPYLDHELVRYVLSLPAQAKIKAGLTKYLVRLAFGAELPGAIVRRTDKIGFEPPQRSWMTEASCREMIRAATAALVGRGILDRSCLNRPPSPNDAYTRGEGNWNLLMASKLYD